VVLFAVQLLLSFVCSDKLFMMSGRGRGGRGRSQNLAVPVTAAVPVHAAIDNLAAINATISRLENSMAVWADVIAQNQGQAAPNPIQRNAAETSSLKADGLKFDTNRSQMRFLGDIQQSLEKNDVAKAQDLLRKRANQIRINDQYGFTVGRVFETGTGLSLEQDEKALLQQAICTSMLSGGGPSTSSGYSFRGRGSYGFRGYQHGGFPYNQQGRRRENFEGGRGPICYFCKAEGHIKSRCPLYLGGNATAQGPGAQLPQ